MDNQVHNAIVSFIWGIADDCLRDVYVRGKYRDVILPMTVIRRLDAMLEDTKPAVLEMKKTLDAAGVVCFKRLLNQSVRKSLKTYKPTILGKERIANEKKRENHAIV